MSNSYHKGARKPTQPAEGTVLLTVVQDFLETCRNPAVLEFGDDLIRLRKGEFAVEVRSGRLWIEIWSDRRHLSRRILTIEKHAPGVLDCTVQLFGGKSGKLSFLDLDRPQTANKTLQGERQNFAEQFRRMLFRQFPGWQILSVSAGMDLQRSFSPIFPRANLVRGQQQIAAIACPSLEDESALLTSALLWYHHLRARNSQGTNTSLCLFLPSQAGNLTALRLRWLAVSTLQPRVFRFNEHGLAGEVDPADLGNLQTAVSACHEQAPLSPELASLVARLHTIQDVSLCPELSGSLSLRYRGLEFARIENGRLSYGLETKQEVEASHFQHVDQFVSQLANLRMPLPASSTSLTCPERWLEACVRDKITVIDASLLPTPVHGQVLTFAAADRDMIDLLAVSLDGRLAVLELKVSEDIHLPLQALDYWMRIARHSEAGELGHFFPRRPLAPKPPRLLLVAPAMCFHSTSSTILRYFSPEIDVERIGVTSDWQQNLKVVLRLHGAETPLSHGRFQ